MSDADVKPPNAWTKRPNFTPSQLLTATQLNTLMDEQRGRIEALMRGLHGHGVIFGFLVKPGIAAEGANAAYDKDSSEGCSSSLRISCGMALDRHGRLLHWPDGSLEFGEIVDVPECAGDYTLLVHYARRSAPAGGCGPCGEESEWIEEGVVFTLQPGCKPDDRACPTIKEGKCVSFDAYVCSRTGSAVGDVPAASDLKTACDAPGKLRRVACRDTFYDADSGIPIACVEVRNLMEDPKCEPSLGFGAVKELCAIRPRVYRTPLLYELIRGCQNDLVRVAALGWQDLVLGFPGEPAAKKGDPDKPARTWDNPPTWSEFATRFGGKDHLWIQFTSPIKVATVHPASIFLTVTYWDRNIEYVLTRRIPAYQPEPVDESKGYATRFRLRPHEDWIDNVVNDESNTHEGGSVELTIRGQMLRDRCGNMLNAVPLFYAPDSPVQSRPGDDFVAAFLFQPDTPKPAPRVARAPRATRPRKEIF